MIPRKRESSGFGQPGRHVRGSGPRRFCVQCGERCAPPEGQDACEHCRRSPGVVVRFDAGTGRRIDGLPEEAMPLAWVQAPRTEYL